MDVAARWVEVVARVAAAAERSGRDPARVRIVAATKTVPPERIQPLLAAGCTDLGENRAQELVAKAPELADAPGGPPVWHFIGPLQRNKVRTLAPLVACWHTVDRPALIPGIAAHAPGATVLVQVNLAREPQKAGCDPDDVETLVGQADRAGLSVVATRGKERWMSRPGVPIPGRGSPTSRRGPTPSACRSARWG